MSIYGGNAAATQLSIKMGTGDLAKYPFLSEAGEYLRQSGFGWDEFDRPDTADIIERATERIRASAAGKIYEKLDRYETEIFTFIVSLIIVKSIGLELLVRKFALAEARRAERFIIEDLKRQTEAQKRALFSKIFDDLFKLKVDVTEDGRLFKVSVADYLVRASQFHEEEWKMINRIVQRGQVYLDADEAVRLIRSELAILISTRVRTMNLPPLPESISKKVGDLRIEFAPRYERRVQAITDYPPCIKHALGSINSGENLPHSARVLLATYMLTIGKSMEDIVEIFRNAPDFNEHITRYQIAHLAGAKGSRTKYSVPSCDRLRTENLCFATIECKDIINPIQFGRKKI